MLRYAALESSAVAVRQNQSSRALIIRQQRFSSSYPSHGPNALRKEANEEQKPLSLEIAFQKRLEQTKLLKQQQQQQQQQGGIQQRNIPYKQESKGGLSPNLRQPLRVVSQQQQQQNRSNRPNHFNRPLGDIHGRFRGQQNSGSNARPPMSNSGGNATQQSKSSTASVIREMLAKKTSIAPPKPAVGSISETFKSVSVNANPQEQRPVPRHKKPTGPSIRDMLIQTASPSSSPHRIDMTDVSNLREAFFKTIEIRKEKVAEERDKLSSEKTTSSHNTTTDRPSQRQQEQPAWRRDGAKGFRKRLQQQQREQVEKLDQQRKMRAAVNRSSGAFFMTQEDYIEESTQRKAAEEADKTVTLPPREATIAELSGLFRVKIDDLTKMLKSLGERPRGEDYLVDLDVMELLAMELGFEPIRSTRRRTKPDDDKNLLLQRRAGADATEETEEALAQAEAYESLPPRPPVVCIMGHVDHGKTTLMDALRQRSKGLSTSNKTAKKSKKAKKGGKKVQTSKDDAVAGTEAGGITQVISAFQVPLENQENAVTFLDTPGHAAFRAMRESGSNAADVIVLVVAADDGVSPQTVEIINFYKSIVKGSGGGGISMVVAMTKIDKHGIDVDESRQRIENQLLEHGILSESFGSSGESEYGPPVQVVPVSGLTGEGLDDLIEGLVLQSEIMDLRADEKAQGEGIVMDARMEKGVGIVADCIIRWGTLERGSVIVSGVHSGKVKALKDSKYSFVQRCLL